MTAGDELLDLASAAGARTIFFVGTGRNVGKTTSLRATYLAACRRGVRGALAAIGRDNDGAELAPAQRKPRIFVRAGTVFATARRLLARSPASEILALSRLQGASGPLLYARAMEEGSCDLAGPATASGVREVVAELQEWSDLVIVDGAVDRIAAVADSQGVIVIACGAATAHTPQEAIDDVTALVARLRVERYDPAKPALQLEGALTASRAAELVARRETRQIVVGDPTQIALSGKAARRALERLDLRCLRPLRPVAVTVSSIGPERSFEPRAFVRDVAAATGLPAFDLYAGERAA